MKSCLDVLHFEAVCPILQVTPCLEDGKNCKAKDTITNETRNISVGLPQEVTNLTVFKTDSYTCSVTWEEPLGVPMGYITRYEVCRVT